MKKIFLSLLPFLLLMGCSSPLFSAKNRAVTAKEKTPQRNAPQPRVLYELDADRNGLYDDRERAAVLAVLAEECPELKGPWDKDGNGRVSIEEQTLGQHPLPMRIPRRFLKSSKKIPWTVDLFPEWLMTAYFQEDLPPGPVTQHSPRGIIIAMAKQANPELQPRKTAAGRGIEFAANSGQYLQISGQRDARWNYRWCLFIFRIDGTSGTARTTTLLDLNHGLGPNRSSPKIWYTKGEGLYIQYVGRNGRGLDRRIMRAQHVVTDGTTWNVLVCGIRYGNMYASLNGSALSTSTLQPGRFSGEWVTGRVSSYIGDPATRGNVRWAYDTLIFGQSEPSEAMVRKLTGWAAHRVRVPHLLPPAHPYRHRVPVLDEEDFPYRYVHDNNRWLQWGRSLGDKTALRINAGKPRIEPQGFERVFFDDFRAYRVRPGNSAEADLWCGPGFNPAVGASAALAIPGKQPNTYPYDAQHHQQILSLVKKDKRWYASAIYTVNDMGYGYTWKGPKIFRIRCKFPKIPQNRLAGGLFPAFWSYDPDYLFWRTANRIEVDWIEWDGQNGHWYNGISSHVHYAHVKSIFPKNPKSYKRFKVYSGELTEKKGKIPGGLYFWDGQFHTWEWVVDARMTYTNVTIKDREGKERWIEVCRCKTAPTYLERLDLQIDYALRSQAGVPKDGKRQDFIIDWVEVLQKRQQIEQIPAPFLARPQLSGKVEAGAIITCKANLPAEITDIRYYWFAGGYPLTYGAANTYRVTPAEAGKSIRCMVKAVGARDMPEAWSNVLP